MEYNLQTVDSKELVFSIKRNFLGQIVFKAGPAFLKVYESDAKKEFCQDVVDGLVLESKLYARLE